MSWTDALQNIIGKYTGGDVSGSEAEDYQHAAAAAPPQVVGQGISEALRSDRTPAFPEMTANLFNNSDPNQRAGLLNQLLASLGPGALASLPGLGGLASILGGGQQVTPQRASQISPAQVQEVAAQAQQRNPSIIDQVGNFYAQHPQVVQALGGLALSIALQHMARNRQ